MLKYKPAVFAVGNEYQITALTEENVLFSVKVGKEIYSEEVCGLIPSLSPIHRVSVPMAKLDAAGEYTVEVRPFPERRPYFSVAEEGEETVFPFSPVPKENARLFHISDTHDRADAAIAAAKASGDIDLLVLNGDLPESSQSTAQFEVIWRICEELTGGRLPVVCTRGNHDMRGKCAELFPGFLPRQNGNTFYTFRLGSLWGLVLDCGEDKPDGRVEYGPTVACHPMRQRQTVFLETLIQNAAGEYAADGVTTRLVICHIPFPLKFEDPFLMEEDLYGEWTRLLRSHVRPHLFLAGHTHKVDVVYPADPADHHGLPCPLAVASAPTPDGFVGGKLTLGKNALTLTYNDHIGNPEGVFMFEKE
ncbi:MAG: metallophosphoesterase [Clostridia bacterium]|nr:metallophosphoesterase [Clostridia bacterium]